MNLIRNGGFERGTTDFWNVESNGTLEVDSVNQKYGTYCGKFISGGVHAEDIISKDYISVTPYQIIDAAIWIKSPTTITTRIVLYLYDADYSYIEELIGVSRDMDGSYLMLNSQFIIPETCAYIRFGCQIIYSNGGDVFYLDGASLNILLPDSCESGVVELLPMDTYIDSGWTYYQRKDMKQFSSYYAQLNCIMVVGTSPTMDVQVHEQDAFDQDIVIGTFTRVTEMSNERIDLPHTQGKQMYMTFTISGTDPEFTFGVAVIGKR